MRAVDLGRRCGLRQAAGAGLVLGASCWFAPGWAGSKESPSLNDTAALMRWVQGAMTQRSFSGTYVVSAGGSMSSSRIVHICDGRTQVERIESLDGRARQIYRHNETVHVFWPDTKEATVEQRDFIRRFPLQAGQGDSVPPLDMYELNDRGQERLAGQDAWVLNFKARDNLRFAQRWWVDKRTGLLLRADTYGTNGDVVESAAFSEIQVGTKQAAQQLIQEMNRLDGFRVRRPVTTATDLESEGWSMGHVVPGFHPVSTVRRQRFSDTRPATEAPSASNSGAQGVNATSVAAGASASPGATTMLQTIYSDGLTHVSLFIEPYAARPRKGERLVSTGATHALTRRLGEWWITVVGDVPGDTLNLFVSALERRRP